ncbi:MAG: stage II sporulation protein D [Clostridia bacterium]|nr:stage II sporulation protein D [Clostridia bacterium]
MKNYILSSLFIFFLILCLPLSGFPLKGNNVDAYTVKNEQTADSSDSLRVLQASTGNILTLDFQDYLIGAVAAEMPASFSEEALKAQSVACYTYALWIIENADRAPDSLFDISDDSSKHQGYLTNADMKDKWGDKYEKYYSKIKKAVTETRGEYISFSSKPAMTVFHGLSSGKTVSAKELWGYDIPYLISVDAPGDKLSPDLISENEFTKEEFSKIVTGITEQKASTDISADVSDVTRDGYLNKLSINGAEIGRSDIRSAFSLKSSCFKIQITEDQVIFSVYGRGHGIGMSQYSADFMARQGYDYKEILGHFYPGTELKENKHLQNGF